MTIFKGKLQGKFLTTVVIAITITTFLCILFAIKTYKMQLQLVRLELETQASRLERIITYTFDYAEYLLEHTEQQIYQNSTNINYIGNLVKSFKNTEHDAKSIFSTSIFSWIDKDLNIVANNILGIFSNPINLSNIDFWQEVAKNTGKFYIGTPRGAYTNGQWIIPGAIGLVDKNYEYIGTITIGIDVGRLNEKLAKSLTNKGMSFVIIDTRDKEIVTDLPRDKYITVKLDPTLNLQNIDFQKNTYGMLSKYTFLNTGYPESYYLTSSNYPYAVIINYDGKVINQQILSVLLPQVFIFCSMICALTALLFIIHSNILKPIISLSNFANSITSGKERENVIHTNELAYELTNLYDHLLKIERYIGNEKLINKQLYDTKEDLRIALERTEKMNHEIKVINSKLEDRVQERTKELAKALAAKTEFLNNISHEVRTPIQGIISLSQGLVDHWNKFSENKRFELAEIVASNGQRLLSLVSNLLDLSKFTAGKMTFNKEKFPLGTLIEDMIIECKNLYIRDKKINIKFIHNNLNNTMLYIDKEKITQVLRNLCANAVKFMESGDIIVELNEAEIWHGSSKSQKGLLFTITDQGMGIPEEELETIFEPFSQSSRTKSNAGGTGLGLSICREIILAHDGRVWAENNRDKGAKFNILLPIISSDALPQPKQQAIKALIEQEKISYAPTILLIDDEETCLMSMSILLFGSNYNLVTANNGRNGLKYLEENPNVDLILLDLMLPDMYGLNVLSEIKENPLLAHIPVILQSGISDDVEIKKAFSLGAIESIRKPYQKDMVLFSIAKTLQTNPAI